MKSFIPRLFAFTLFSSGLALFLVPGCGGVAGEYCEVYCDCVLCNDHNDDFCGARAAAFMDEADIYECTPEAEVLANCVIDEHDCDDNQFDPEIPGKCDDEYIDWAECIEDGSDVIQLTQPDPPAEPAPPTTLPGMPGFEQLQRKLERARRPELETVEPRSD